MFTVGFDVSALDPHFREHAWRGIGRYVRQLRAEFDRLQSDNIQIKDFNHQTFIPRKIIDCLPFGRVTVEQQVFFPLQLWWQAGKQFDILHFPAHMDAPSWSKVPYIITVLDLIPLVMQDLYKADRPSWRFKLARSLEIQAIKNASLILTISQNTADDVERILGVSKDRIRVTPLGVDQKFFTTPENINQQQLRDQHKIPADRPIILYVGGIDQRKNYPFLIATIAELAKYYQQQQLPAPILVMVGGIEKDLQYPRLLKLIKEHAVEQDVVLTGFVADNTLQQLYAISSIFLFLSSYEGFGLPVLEAMACGLPFVAGNNSCLPEVSHRPDLLVDVTNLDQIVRAVKTILDQPIAAKDIAVAGIKAARQFTWQRTAQLTLSAYQEFQLSKQRVINA